MNALDRERPSLGIFAVDGEGTIHWYHPAWLRPDEDPPLIPLAKDSDVHELREAIEQDMKGAQISIYALFTQQPRTVRDVEELVRDGTITRGSSPPEIVIIRRTLSMDAVAP